MSPIRIILSLFCLTLYCQAQLPNKSDFLPLKGNFYVSVDDTCTIFVNGQSVYKAKLGQSRSPDLELKVGDRIVVQLQNDGDKRYFTFLFAASNGQSIISFKHRDFKIVPDIGISDFTPELFQSWTKFAKEEEKNKTYVLPVKSASEFIWGDLDTSIIAGVITQQMIAQKSK